MVGIRALTIALCIAVSACAGVSKQANQGTSAAPVTSQAAAVQPIAAPASVSESKADAATPQTSSSTPTEKASGAMEPPMTSPVAPPQKSEAKAPAAPKPKAAKKPVVEPTTPASPAADSALAKPAPLATGSVATGRIQLSAAAGQNADPNEITDAVVYFVPDTGASRPAPGRFQIFSLNKQFDPPSLVVPVGSTVSFPNKDEVLHNVFSVSPGSEFDLGLYGEGKSQEVTLKKPGVVLVNCNVHPLMQVSILVLDTPYFAHPSKLGDFKLAGLPSVPGKLVLWHPRAGTQIRAISPNERNDIVLQLVLSKPRIEPHLNKERKPYQSVRG